MADTDDDDIERQLESYQREQLARTRLSRETNLRDVTWLCRQRKTNHAIIGWTAAGTSQTLCNHYIVVAKDVGIWTAADPQLPVCKLCRDAAQRRLRKVSPHETYVPPFLRTWNQK